MEELQNFWDNFRDLVPGKPEGQSLWDMILRAVDMMINFFKGIFGALGKIGK